MPANTASRSARAAAAAAATHTYPNFAAAAADAVIMATKRRASYSTNKLAKSHHFCNKVLSLRRRKRQQLFELFFAPAECINIFFQVAFSGGGGGGGGLCDMEIDCFSRLLLRSTSPCRCVAHLAGLESTRHWRRTRTTRVPQPPKCRRAPPEEERQKTSHIAASSFGKLSPVEPLRFKVSGLSLSLAANSLLVGAASARLLLGSVSERGAKPTATRRAASGARTRPDTHVES